MLIKSCRTQTATMEEFCLIQMAGLGERHVWNALCAGMTRKNLEIDTSNLSRAGNPALFSIASIATQVAISEFAPVMQHFIAYR